MQSGRNSPSPGTATSMAPFSRPPQPSSDNLRSVIQLSSERSYLCWNTTTDSSCKLEICLWLQANFWFYLYLATKSNRCVSVFLLMLHVIKWFIFVISCCEKCVKTQFESHEKKNMQGQRKTFEAISHRDAQSDLLRLICTALMTQQSSIYCLQLHHIFHFCS